jgi:hypothetical protein
VPRCRSTGVLTCAYSRSDAILVSIVTGASSSDADYRANADARERLVSDAGTRHCIAAYIVDEAHGQPPAPWRKRWAEQRLRQAGTPLLVVVVTESKVARAVVTAIRWLQPPPHLHKVVVKATLPEALDCAERERAGASRAISKLYAEALGVVRHPVGFETKAHGGS